MDSFALAASGILSAVALATLAVGVRSIRRLKRTVRELKHTLQRTQTTFDRFLPPEIVNELLTRGELKTFVRKKVTVLFTDIQGFTERCETVRPEEIQELLAGYFEIVSDEVTKNHGFTIKFLGDGVLAVFGAVAENRWQEKGAVDAALALQRRIGEFNRHLQESGRLPIQVSVGINTGDAVVGVVGSQHLKEFSVLGDTVNTASRIEGLTRTFGKTILVGRSTADGLTADEYQLQEMPDTPVKGKSSQVKTFSVEAVLNEGRRE